MIIAINEAVNGYMIAIVDRETGHRHYEICEREVEAWGIVRKYAEHQEQKAVQRIRNANVDVEI